MAEPTELSGIIDLSAVDFVFILGRDHNVRFIIPPDSPIRTAPDNTMTHVIADALVTTAGRLRNGSYGMENPA